MCEYFRGVIGGGVGRGEREGGEEGERRGWGRGGWGWRGREGGEDSFFGFFL